MPDLTSVHNPPNPNPEMFIFSLAQEKNRTATAIKYLINIKKKKCNKELYGFLDAKNSEKVLIVFWYKKNILCQGCH